MILTNNIYKNRAKYFVVVVFSLLLVFVSKSFSSIIDNPNSSSDTIKMGLCLVDVSRDLYDSLETKFIISNDIESDLIIGGSEFSFAIRLLSGFPDEFEEFNVRRGDIPLSIQQNESKDLVLKYLASPFLLLYPPGKKHCLVRIGVYDPDNVSDPIIEEDMIEYKDYVLIAKKTIKYIDSFDEVISFDTVYVKPPKTLERFWKAENIAGKDIRIEAEQFLRINSDAEINYYGYGFDYDFPKDTSKDWKFTYFPENPGPDSAIMVLKYKPHPIEHPDSSDATQVKIQGYGALQKLSIVNVEGAMLTGDTIDLGEINVGTNLDVKVSIRNDGNIPFGALSENIFEVGSDIPSQNFFLLQKLFESGEDLYPKMVRSFSFSFTPPQKGNYIARYELESDLMDRNIYGYPRSAEKVRFYIKAKSIEPIISFAKDTLDFGNIVIHSDCPTRRDTSIFIANAGNTELTISDVILDPPPPSPFSIEVNDLTIPAGEQKLFKISFSTQAQAQDTLFQWKLVFVSNSTPPLDTFYINLKARGIEPYPVNLALPDLKSKTGRILTFPITVEKDRVWRAKTFDTKLSYNNTLLRFYDHLSFGTGSDGAKSIQINENIDAQELDISIEMPTDFGFSDTLIFLRFSTYLGNEKATPITFLNPVFGDGNCPKALNPNIKNGSFSLDSICGLEYKTVPLPDDMVFVSKVSPNPTLSSANIFFHIPIDVKVDLKVYNSFGNEVKVIVNDLLFKGDYEEEIDCSDLSPGVYVAVFKINGFSHAERFVVAR
jgi:hypothetical protein